MGRTLLRGTCVLLASLSVVVLIEWGASFFVRMPSDQVARNMRLHHSSTAYYEGPNLSTAWGYPVRFNGQGWREDYDVELAKPAETVRVFYVGDSFTEGICPVDVSVPVLVEDALNTHFADKNVSFEVINAGTGSYATILYYIQIRYFLLAYDPDLIVINVDMTDVADDWRYQQMLLEDEHGDPWAVPPTKIYWRDHVTTAEGVTRADFMTKARFFLSNHSYTYRLLNKKLRRRSPPAVAAARRDELIEESKQRAEDRIHYSWCQYDWDEQVEEDVRYSMDILGKILEVCREQGVKTLVCGVPHWQHLSGDRERPTWSLRPHREIELQANEHGAVYVDSVAALAPEVHGTPHDDFYNPDDFHLNGRGNRIWARAHFEAIVDPQNDLLPESVRSEE